MAEQADDPRAVRSRAALIGAMTALLDEEELDAVSVTRLAAAAGVTRPTFYQHWTDLAALASEAAVARLSAEFARHGADSVSLSARPPVTASDWRLRLGPVVHELVAHLADHADFYRRVFTGSAATLVFDATVELVDERILLHSPLGERLRTDAAAGASDRDRVAIVAGGLVWLLSRWLLTERRGPDAVAAMADRVRAQLIELAR